MLSRLATEFVAERAKPFAHNELGNFVRRDMALEAKKQVMYLPFDLKIKGSVGAGNWASVPWLVFMDPLITETATKGFYVVYLINPQTEEFYLSLNQGATDIYNDYGEKRGREVLKRRAIDISERIPQYAKRFETDPIDLGSTESLPQGYCAGHAFGRRYKANSIGSDEFSKDLGQMLYAYEALINLGGTTPLDAMQGESNATTVEETRRYVLSRRIERAPNVRPEVLKRRRPVCEACGLDPAVHYGYDGPIKNTPLDVHHSKAISGMAEGESRRYRIPDDFLILCPTCHRLIHKQADAGDIDLLKTKIRFRLVKN
jgi:hypothetical protein